ncbi:hypothetical protein RRG08_013522 [Elysia crispata]|uniref:Uncharacterized protein n=1 Tax=Elysia crispata TaxID=231223 RepID=A0AAE1CQH6_9GAST|nr:hypothetical protein RRG08_013522 [Elysia crispata]
MPKSRPSGLFFPVCGSSSVESGAVFLAHRVFLDNRCSGGRPLCLAIAYERWYQTHRPLLPVSATQSRSRSGAGTVRHDPCLSGSDPGSGRLGTRDRQPQPGSGSRSAFTGTPGPGLSGFLSRWKFREFATDKQTLRHCGVESNNIRITQYVFFPEIRNSFVLEHKVKHLGSSSQTARD